MATAIVLERAVSRAGKEFASSFQAILQVRISHLSWQGCSDLQSQISGDSLVIILFNEPPETLSSDERDPLYRLLVDKCVKERKRLVHIVRDFDTPDSGNVVWRMSRRAERIFRFHDLKSKSVAQLATDIKEIKDNGSFSSPGESFAWQLVIGFLSYILPSLRASVRSTLLDDQDLILADILRDYDLTDVVPKQVLVIPKYYILLSEQIVRGESSVAMTPTELFAGCRKISKGSSDLSLEFDSPGYAKRIPAYLMKLGQPLAKGEATFTHVLTFCGYAAPMYVMQKLDMTAAEKASMFQQFSEELQRILKHPRLSSMLRAFGDSKSTETDGLESSCVQLIDVTDERSIESVILQETKSDLLAESFNQLQLTNPAEETCVDDDDPLISVAFAMAANCWIGFSQILLSHIQSLKSKAEQLPFDLPYCFVIPSSSRYPDEAKLHKRFVELDAISQQQQFQVSSGRRYTFRVHSWKSRRIAFEIPPSVLGLRKQAECGLGGVRTVDLAAHLAEFQYALARFVSDSGGCFKVIEWDDLAEFGADASMEPTVKFAQSLLSCLSASVQAESASVT